MSAIHLPSTEEINAAYAAGREAGIFYSHMNACTPQEEGVSKSEVMETQTFAANYANEAKSQRIRANLRNSWLGFLSPLTTIIARLGTLQEDIPYL